MKEDNMSIMISNIQRMCFEDGPGVRTTVFLKGCSIACPWCSNPENIKFNKQYYFDVQKCKRDGNLCPFNQKCIVLRDENLLNSSEILEEERSCPIQAIGCYGKEYEAQELVEILLKDRIFWENDGGVTFSGGEALMQTPQLLEVWRLLKEQGVHIAVETALFVPESYICQAIEYVDLFLIDVKILKTNMCKQILGGDIELYFKNIEKIVCNRNEILFRIPCSVEYVLQEDNWNRICNFLYKYKQYPVQLFALHDLAEKKYNTLGYQFYSYEKIDKVRLEKYCNELQRAGCNACVIEL